MCNPTAPNNHRQALPLVGLEQLQPLHLQLLLRHRPAQVELEVAGPATRKQPRYVCTYKLAAFHWHRSGARLTHTK